MNKNSVNEQSVPPFDEEEAYQELLIILQQAIEMQSLNSVEPLLQEWKKKYPLEKFSDVYKKKIKALKSYFEQEYRVLLNLAEKKKVDTVKAYFELCKIVGNAKWDRNLNLAKSKIETWKNRYYTSDMQNDFSSKYKTKISHLTDEAYLFSITERIDQKAAIDELTKLIEEAKAKRNFEEFEKNFENWSKKYPYDDLKSDSKTTMDRLLRYEYQPVLEEYQTKLQEANDLGVDMSKEDPNKIEEIITTNIMQKSAYFELIDILKTPDDVLHVLDWIYKYRLLHFDDYHKGLILEKTAPYYQISKSKTAQISKIGTTNDLSFDEFNMMDQSRKLAVTQYLTILYSGQNLGDEDRHRLESVYEKSQKALLIEEIYEEANEFEKQQEPPLIQEQLDPLEIPTNNLFDKK